MAQLNEHRSDDRGTLKRVHCCGHRGLYDGFRGELDTYMCYCPCHDPTEPVVREGKRMKLRDSWYRPEGATVLESVCIWCLRQASLCIMDPCADREQCHQPKGHKRGARARLSNPDGKPCNATRED